MLTEGKHLNANQWILNEMFHSVQHDNVFMAEIVRSPLRDINENRDINALGVFTSNAAGAAAGRLR
jgi:hypothetical protein